MTTQELIWSARRLNALARALRAESYLEIGINTGTTFFSVQIPNKTAVDITIPFDTSLYKDSNTSFHEKASDDFFATLSPAKSFDLIFLDGLHTFEQTYRDLCNSLLHSHVQTIFLIDDTLPSDVYSTLRDWPKAHQRRWEAMGGNDASWHGDTFKTIFALHDFYPGLNYRTIVGSGNSQTLVWRSKAGGRKPLLDSFEQISRLSYFDLLDHKHILRECSEAEAITLCLTELAKF